MVQVVILAAKGDFKVGKVGAKPSAAALAKALRKVKEPNFEGSYVWKDTTITIWGWTDGKAGTENKHELPPPHDKVLLFGDVIAAVPKGDLTIEQWKEFYNKAFKGFEDLGSEDSESGDEDAEEEEEAEEDEEFEDDAEMEEDGEADESGDEEDEEDEGEAGEEDEGEANGSATDDEEVEEEADDECYDSDEGVGGGRRRSQRRRTTAAPEYRRMDMGLRSRIKMPVQVGKRAPKWQTAPELEAEGY
jgi:hypothetical protein